MTVSCLPLVLYFLLFSLFILGGEREKKREMRKDNNIVVQLGVIHHHQYGLGLMLNLENITQLLNFPNYEI